MRIDCSRLLVACSALLAVFFSGCGSQVPNADEAIEQGMLLLGNGAEPKTLDPHLATGVTENHIISALIEGLIAYHATDDNLPEPGVAASWEANEESSEWTFHLREDARWSNGDPVTAHDFVYSYERMLHPRFTGEYAQMLFLLKNGEAYKKGEITDFNQVGVEAVDDYTLRIQLKGPVPFFLNMLKHYSWYPVHPPTIEAHGGMFDRSGRWTRPGYFVGNGPFVFEEHRQNQYIKVTKSPTYWDRARMRLNGIYFFPIEDVNTEKRMFESGKLHVTGTVPSNEVPRLREMNDRRIHIDPYLGTYFYRFNLNRPPLDNPLVRKALALSIDRQAIVDRVTLSDQQPAYAYVPPGFRAHRHPDNVLSYNPEEARRLFAAAGYPNGQGFPRLELLFNTSEGHRKIAEAVVEMWNRNLGIDMQLDNAEWKVYLDRQSHQQYDISRSAWIGDYMDPITFLEMWTSNNGNNDTGWSNGGYDALIEQAWMSGSQDEHLTALRQAEHILLDELPIIPVYYYTRVYLLDERVKGWNPKLLDNRPYKYLWLEEAGTAAQR